MCECSAVSADGKIGVWDMLNDGEVELLGTKDVGSTIESISVDPLGDRLYFASGSDLWVLPTNSMGGELSRRWKDACSDSKPVSERAKDHNSGRKLDAARKKICCLCACPCSIPDKRIVVSGSEVGCRSDALYLRIGPTCSSNPALQSCYCSPVLGPMQ